MSLLRDRYVDAIPSRWWPYIAAVIVAGAAIGFAIRLHEPLLAMPRPLRLAIVFVMSGAVVTAVFAWTDRQEETQAALPVELTATGIQSGPWDSIRISNTDVVHGRRVILTPVRITNRSATNRLN